MTARASSCDVSIVIPTRNRPEFLPETIESLLAQSLPPREIIVVDNGGDPGVADAAVDRFGSAVALIREPVPGQQAARNAGIRHAGSAWVACLDDDDLYHPDFLKTAAAIMADGRADVIGCDHVKFRGDATDAETNFDMAPPGYWDGLGRDSGEPWSFIGKFPLDRLLRRVPLYPSMTIMRRDLALAIGGYDRRMFGVVAEDIEFLVRLFAAGNLALIWAPMVRYRVHDGNDSHGHTRQVLGRWRIFQFIADDHRDLPDYFRAALARDLPERRRAVFDTAFHFHEPEMMAAAAAEFTAEDWTPARRLKRIAAHLPRGVIDFARAIAGKSGGHKAGDAARLD